MLVPGLFLEPGLAGGPTKVIVARDHWKVDELGHVQWQWRKGQMDDLQKLATGGKGRFKNFEKAMTRAFGAELREQQGASDEPACLPSAGRS